MPFGIIDRTGPGMREVVGFGIGSQGGVLLGANLGRAVVTKGAFTAYVCYSAATQPFSQITLGRLVIIIIVVVVVVVVVIVIIIIIIISFEEEVFWLWE